MKSRHKARISRVGKRGQQIKWGVISEKKKKESR